MVSLWLASKADEHVKEVEIVYPVKGQSFLPRDFVFGNLERDLKKKEVIVNPHEVYHQVVCVSSSSKSSRSM